MSRSSNHLLLATFVSTSRLKSAIEFEQRSSAMIAKMSNTIPSDVTLTNEIVLLPVKVSSADITVVKDRLIFSISLWVTIHSNLPIKFRFSIAVSSQRPSRPHETTCSGVISEGIQGLFWKHGTNLIFGTPPTFLVAKAKKAQFLGYQFAVPIFANQSVSKFWFEFNEGKRVNSDYLWQR